MSAQVEPASTSLERFRFRPRYRLFAGAVFAAGALFAAIGIATSNGLAVVVGSIGLVSGLAYFANPAWRVSVHTSREGLAVHQGAQPKFRLPWTDIERVIASPLTKTCFVDGGTAERSLKLPGKGAPASYAIEDRELLYDIIVDRTPADRVQLVTYLEVASIDDPAPQDSDSDATSAAADGSDCGAAGDDPNETS